VPIFFQHQINDTTRLGIWKIEETEEFFLNNVPLQKEVTHPHKKLQHLAGRFLLQFLFPGFPYELIKIANTRKPYLPDEQYHFSISHCGDYAAAIVSSNERVGIDIEIPTKKVQMIKQKFLTHRELEIFQRTTDDFTLTTLLWSCKESVYKWYGDGSVNFRHHIRLQGMHENDETVLCDFAKASRELMIHYKQFDHLILTWIIS
jgi:phosphopantetheinyl transferase